MDHNDITIFNGHIRGGVTNNGSGSYSGSGFAGGINFVMSYPVNARVTGVSVTGCSTYGIYLGTNYSTAVESCTVQTVGFYGIAASTIKSCVALDCGHDAITGYQVSDSRGESTRDGFGIYAYTAQNCSGSSANYIGLLAYTALNCHCAALGNGNGLYGGIAQNCYGYSGGSGNGLLATTAQNCYGYNSSSGYGINAFTAQNCYGYNNGSGVGLYADDLAIGCSGYSTSGTGLAASHIANSCRGTTTSGTGQTISYKYNMP